MNATIPQPRKPNHTIIINIIDAARNPIATLRPTDTDVGRALIDDCNSTGRGSFIRRLPPAQRGKIAKVSQAAAGITWHPLGKSRISS
jgi:hypothetical protein